MKPLAFLLAHEFYVPGEFGGGYKEPTLVFHRNTATLHEARAVAALAKKHGLSVKRMQEGGRFMGVLISGEQRRMGQLKHMVNGMLWLQQGAKVFSSRKP